MLSGSMFIILPTFSHWPPLLIKFAAKLMRFDPNAYPRLNYPADAVRGGHVLFSIIWYLPTCLHSSFTHLDSIVVMDPKVNSPVLVTSQPTIYRNLKVWLNCEQDNGRTDVRQDVTPTRRCCLACTACPAKQDRILLGKTGSGMAVLFRNR